MQSEELIRRMEEALVHLRAGNREVGIRLVRILEEDLAREEGEAKNSFEDRIRKKQWWGEDEEPIEWYKSGGGDSFVEAGNKLVSRGFSVEETLSILGDCHSAVAGEYGE